MNHREKYFCSPPDEEHVFSELFKKIWDTGIGRELDEYGQPQAWTALALEEAFGLNNVNISQRAIEYWRSGESVPSQKNMRALAALIAAEDMFEPWLKAIQSAVKRQKSQGRITKEALLKKEPVNGPADEVTKGANTRTLPMPAFAIVAALGIGLVWFIIAKMLEPAPPVVVDLKICSPTNFSEPDLLCAKNEDQFPAGTKKIYLSFDFENLGRGEQFHRKWFIDGRLFLEKSSHFIEPWEGWTWLGNLDHNSPEALDMELGRYTLQIHAGRTIEVRSFVIGPLSEDLAEE